MIHSLLQRQLRKLKASGDTVDVEALLQIINQTYEEYDHQLRLQDHAVQLMSDELNELNVALRRERDEKVAESQKRFELAVEGTNDGIWDWNVAEDGLWMSARILVMLGYDQPKSREGTIADWYSLLDGQDLLKAEAFIKGHLKGETLNAVTLRFKHKYGENRHIMCRAFAVKDANGRVTRLIGVHTDITSFMRMQEKLQEAIEVAKKASAAKSDFLANMSHELRTPLNSMLGMMRLLLESKLDDEQRNLAETVFRSSTHLLEIVNDILDLSKIEAGEMQLEKIGVDLAYVVHSAVQALEQLAREKRLTVVKEYEKEQFPYVTGDPVRLTHILINLIGNAIKYTDKGHVRIKAFHTREDERHIAFHCEISDTGIGIPQEKIGAIFEKFVQADSSNTRKYGGTGLGLAITRQLVEMMNGKIEVESTFGAGSTFRIVIPFEITDQLSDDKRRRRKKMLSGAIPPATAQLLVAEDHPLNQLLINKLLKRFGIGTIDIVENGHEVLKRYKEKDWDVILMDCHMPERNGYDTTKDIRNLEKGSNKHVPIVAMTANAMVGDKEKCLRHGMDEYISKPISFDELKEVLGQWIKFEDLDIAAGNHAIADEVLDLTRLKSFSEGDEETERKLAQTFVMQSDKNLKTLLENKNGEDPGAWKEASHMFKGGAASIGAKTLSALCQEAQHFEGAPQNRATLFGKIDAEYARVKERLRKAGLLIE